MVDGFQHDMHINYKRKYCRRQKSSKMEEEERVSTTFGGRERPFLIVFDKHFKGMGMGRKG